MKTASGFRGIVAVGLFLLTVVSTATAKYSGGSGTAQDPYQIATAADLIALGETTADYDKHFVLTADINLDPKLPGRKVFDKAVIAPCTGWPEGTPFTGIFDGNGHAISHLTIESGSYPWLGLFGQLGNSAGMGIVKDLGVVDVSVTGSRHEVGALVGRNHGFVTHCYSTGTVRGYMAVGGLVGRNDGFVTQCYSTGLASGDQIVGGLVGSNEGGTVTQCYSTGPVSGHWSWLIGGLAGTNGGGTVTQCYWDIQSSGQDKSFGGTGKTTAQMQAIQTYLDAGWDFVDETKNGTSQIWQMPQGGGYPVLAIFHGYTPPQLQGSGTPQDPYLISNAMEVGLVVRYSPFAHYRLAASIDLSGIRWGSAVIPWAAGTFDADGHTISHLTIQGGGRVGLFGQLASGAEVRDLGLVDVNIASSGSHVGALAGRNAGIVTRCYSTGTVNGGADVGGLVGYNGGTMAFCYSMGTFSGTDSVGGLVGYNGGTTAFCYSMGTLSGTDSVGGLVGENYGTVTQCYSTGTVNATGSYIGGLVGSHSSGSVTHCYSTGAVSGRDYVGGLVGMRSPDGDSGFGTGGSVIQCYSTGRVSGSGAVVSGLSAGGSADTVSSCFWDTQTSGQTKNAGGTGKTTTEMQDMRTYQQAGWDFTPAIEDGDRQIWQMPEGGGYPVLAVFNSYTPPQLRGSGIPEDPYLISNTADLDAIVHYSPNSHYRLTASIDLSGSRWALAVIPWFAGTFEGNGHTISHLTIKGGGSLGLFHHLASGAEVRNLGLVDVNITGSGDGVGALAGSNAGAVAGCYSTGAVSGRSYVGGLVGGNGGTMTDCYSTGTVNAWGRAIGLGWVGGLVGSNAGTVTHCYNDSVVSGSRAAGGLVGGNSGRVIQCYSSGSVSGTGWGGAGGLVGENRGSATDCYSTGTVRGYGGYLDVGGLVGWNEGAVTHCYSTGAVSGTSDAMGGLVGSGGGGVTACFWDTQTSDQTKSAGGTARTTTEMQTSSTFLEAGWDFVGETANGTEDIWWILEGSDYPRFVWERGQARLSYPQDGGVDVPQPAILGWRPGGLTLQHDVYFGEDQEKVARATRETPGIYCGWQPPELTTYNPRTLGWGKTYYWRIDEVNEADPNSRWKGRVWSFTTADFIVVNIVDDFESYSHDLTGGMTLCPTWMPGFLNGTRSFFVTVEQEIVHGGRQSMPMDYNVDYEDVRPWYSEVDRTWGTPQDWTIGGADTLTLYFRGEADNGRESLYVRVEDGAGRIAAVAHPDAEAALAIHWQKWHIALAEVRAAGVDVAAVKKMVIGVGDRQNPKPGGTGRIYIDDIRLTKRTP